MSFVVKNTDNDTYLVNRNFNKKKWWSSNIYEAMAFRTKYGAELAKSRLKHGTLIVEEPIEKLGTWDYEEN